MFDLDQIDHKILALVQQSGSASNQELADQLDISASQLSRRIARLREAAVIQKTVAILNPKALGLDIKAYIMVTLSERASRAEAFHQIVRSSPEIVECCSITGHMDFILKVYSHDVHSLQGLLTRLMNTDLVQTLKTNIALVDFKHGFTLSVPRN
jgi:Lrp/AsnC family transcriptional regulator, leucine-responsive regulatory protein